MLRLWERPANEELEAAAFERARRLAVAALLHARKDSPKATRRCRSRTQRALEAIKASTRQRPAPDDAEALAQGADAWVRLACTACGRCPGP